MGDRPDASRPSLLIRADASLEIGVGHIMRCLALCQAWIDDGGQAAFVCAALPDTVAHRLKIEGVPLFPIHAVVGSTEDAEATLRVAAELAAAWIVTDGYRFGTDYHERLRGSGRHVAAIDDKGHLDRYVADLVINQNLHADAISYDHRMPWTQLLLGPRYALLRREFRRWKGAARVYPEQASKLLVLLGGSDPHDHTSRVLDSLAAASLEVTAIIGPANPRVEQIRSRFEGRLRILSNLPDITPLLREADMALSSAGTTVWELALFGTPMILGAALDVEELLATRLARAGGCIYLGRFDSVDPNRIVEEIEQLAADRHARHQLGSMAAKIIDGQGADRVVAAMRTLGVRTM